MPNGEDERDALKELAGEIIKDEEKLDADYWRRYFAASKQYAPSRPQPQYPFLEEAKPPETAYAPHKIFSKMIPISAETEKGEKITVVLNTEDNTVWYEDKQVGSVNPQTGEFTAIEPLFWQKMGAGALEALYRVWEPFRWAGQMTAAPFIEEAKKREIEEQYIEKQVAELPEEEREAARKRLKWELVQTPMLERPEELKVMKGEAWLGRVKGLEERVPEKPTTAWGEISQVFGEEGILREEYEKLSWWQQLLAESPAFVLTGGITATGIRAALAGSIAKGGVKGALARIASGSLLPAAKVETRIAKGITYPVRKVSEKQAERQLFRLFQKLPTNSDLAVILTEDWYRKAARDLSKIPGMKTIIRRINPSGVADSETEKAIMRHLALLETTENKGNAIMVLLQRYGDDIALFNVAEGGLCRGIVLKASAKGKIPLKNGMPALGDVLEYPHYFKLTKPQTNYIKTLWKLEDSVKAMLKTEGINLNEISFREGTHWVHRVTTGKLGEKGVELLRQGSFRPGARKAFTRTRFHQYMLDGIENKVVYGQSANQYFKTYYDGAMRMIADARLSGAVKGATALERMPMAIRQEAVSNALKVRNYTKLVDRLRKIKAEWKAPEATLKAIDKWDVTIGTQVRAILRGEVAVGTTPKQALAKLIKMANQKLSVARGENALSKAAYKRSKEWAMVPHEGEAYINLPFARGKIYPAEAAEAVTKYYGDVARKWLTNMGKMSSASRTAVATFDFSAPFIQGLPVLGHSPHIWAESTLRMFLTFFNEGTHTAYMQKHASTLLEMGQNRCIVMGTEGMHEMVEAIPMIGRVFGKVPVFGKTLQKIFEQTYGRFGAAFSSWGDTTRIMLWESMRDGWAKRGALPQLAQLINHMTGVISTRALGVTSSWRAAESGFLFFAPRYTRAGFALFGDILKGGYTSANAIRAIGGFLGGGTAFYVGACAALGQEPNLDPSSARFMTIKVGNQHIGIGGFITSAVRFAADVVASAADLGEDEPLDFIKLDRYKNPFLRFVYGKAAPMTHLLYELGTQKDFLGRRLESVEDYGRWLADFMIPIAMQTITTQEKKANWQAFLVEMVGGRTFPESVWEQVRKVRNESAMIDYGVEYDKLDIHQKRMLEKNHPEIKQMIGEAEAEWAKWYPDDLRVRYNAEIDDSDALYSDQLWQSFKETRLAVKTTDQFIEKVDDFSIRHAERNAEIGKDYPEVIEQFERWREREREDWLLFDNAYDEYIQTVVAPSWEDEYYNFDFNGYRTAQNAFKQKWGDTIYQEVRETMWLGDDLPPLFLELKASRELWRDYYLQPEGDSREGWRYTNPATEAALFFWGRITTFKNPESSKLVLALLEKYDLPYTSVKGFRDNPQRWELAKQYREGKLSKRQLRGLISP